MTHHEYILAVVRYADGRRGEPVALEDERTNDDADGIGPPSFMAAPAYRHEPCDRTFPDVSERHARGGEDGVFIECGAVFAVLYDRLAKPATGSRVSAHTTREDVKSDLT